MGDAVIFPSHRRSSTPDRHCSRRETALWERDLPGQRSQREANHGAALCIILTALTAVLQLDVGEEGEPGSSPFIPLLGVSLSAGSQDQHLQTLKMAYLVREKKN